MTHHICYYVTGHFINKTVCFNRDHNSLKHAAPSFKRVMVGVVAFRFATYLLVPPPLSPPWGGHFSGDNLNGSLGVFFPLGLYRWGLSLGGALLLYEFEIRCYSVAVSL